MYSHTALITDSAGVPITSGSVQFAGRRGAAVSATHKGGGLWTASDLSADVYSIVINSVTTGHTFVTGLPAAGADGAVQFNNGNELGYESGDNGFVLRDTANQVTSNFALEYGDEKINIVDGKWNVTTGTECGYSIYYPTFSVGSKTGVCFALRNASGTKVSYGKAYVEIVDATAGSEDGKHVFTALKGGVETVCAEFGPLDVVFRSNNITRLRLTGAILRPETANGVKLGSASSPFSEAWIGSAVTPTAGSNIAFGGVSISKMPNNRFSICGYLSCDSSIVASKILGNIPAACRPSGVRVVPVSKGAYGSAENDGIVVLNILADGDFYVTGAVGNCNYIYFDGVTYCG